MTKSTDKGQPTIKEQLKEIRRTNTASWLELSQSKKKEKRNAFSPKLLYRTVLVFAYFSLPSLLH